MGFYFLAEKHTSKMVRMSVMKDALKNICNAEKAGKRQVILRPTSKVLVKFLKVMQRHGYINEFEIIDDARNGKIIVNLNGRLKKFEDFTNAVLPSRQFGIVVLTTNQGIMDHHEARAKHIGGKVLGFFY